MSAKSSLWIAVDEASEGALYTLRYECKTHRWIPRLWAQMPREGSPPGQTRMIFLGFDAVGRTRYFDSALIQDADVGLAVQVAERIQDAARAEKNLREGLARLDQGLDPYPAPLPKNVISELN